MQNERRVPGGYFFTCTYCGSYQMETRLGSSGAFVPLCGTLTLALDRTRWSILMSYMRRQFPGGLQNGFPDELEAVGSNARGRAGNTDCSDCAIGLVQNWCGDAAYTILNFFVVDPIAPITNTFQLPL